jgi:hypothetical protein
LLHWEDFLFDGIVEAGILQEGTADHTDFESGFKSGSDPCNPRLGFTVSCLCPYHLQVTPAVHPSDVPASAEAVLDVAASVAVAAVEPEQVQAKFAVHLVALVLLLVALELPPARRVAPAVSPV